jgi:hypothetical protein
MGGVETSESSPSREGDYIPLENEEAIPVPGPIELRSARVVRGQRSSRGGKRPNAISPVHPYALARANRGRRTMLDSVNHKLRYAKKFERGVSVCEFADVSDLDSGGSASPSRTPRADSPWFV